MPCETYFSKDGCKHFYKATKAMVDFAEQIKRWATLSNNYSKTSKTLWSLPTTRRQWHHGETKYF